MSLHLDIHAIAIVINIWSIQASVTAGLTPNVRNPREERPISVSEGFINTLSPSLKRLNFMTEDDSRRIAALGPSAWQFVVRSSNSPVAKLIISAAVVKRP